MKKWDFRKWIHRTGSLLALLGLAYLVSSIYQKADAFEKLSPATLAFALALATLYASTNALLAHAWLNILYSLKLRPSLRWTMKAYGTYQITKYVPGNVANILGRQSLGMAAGLPAMPIARSTIWELGLLAISGSTYAVLLAPLQWEYVSIATAGAGFVLISLVLMRALAWLFDKEIAKAQALQTLFLALSGLSFVALLKFLDPEAIPDATHLLFVLAAFNFAWLVGMVTPGAPAGIGVREAMLVGMLGHLVPDEALLLAVLLNRMINVFGDMLFWLGTTLLIRLRVDKSIAG